MSLNDLLMQFIKNKGEKMVERQRQRQTERDREREKGTREKTEAHTIH